MVLTTAPERDRRSPVSVIIVTHNSEDVLGSCLESLMRQSIRPEPIIIVDSGSDDTCYLEQHRSIPGCEIHLRENLGFAAANNLGITLMAKRSKYVLFVNPDTFLANGCIETAIDTISRHEDIAILTGDLKGFDISTGQPTGLLDSTGIFRKWYGRWYDRDQGRRQGAIPRNAGNVPAVCGAFMFCRSSALEPEIPSLFDEGFFMYKEDIDLCLRLRKKGWVLYYTPGLSAFHCRGWLKNRKQVDLKLRLLSAKNEMRLCTKHRSPYIIWAMLKYVLVRFANI